MSEVLGHDIEGRPLRAGDRCVVTDLSWHPELARYTGTVLTITGAYPPLDGFVDTDLPDHKGDTKIAHMSVLRRIDDRPETVTWESMRDIWQPSEVVA